MNPAHAGPSAVVARHSILRVDLVGTVDTRDVCIRILCAVVGTPWTPYPQALCSGENPE